MPGCGDRAHRTPKKAPTLIKTAFVGGLLLHLQAYPDMLETGNMGCKTGASCVPLYRTTVVPVRPLAPSPCLFASHHDTCVFIYLARRARVVGAPYRVPS